MQEERRRPETRKEFQFRTRGEQILRAKAEKAKSRKKAREEESEFTLEDFSGYVREKEPEFTLEDFGGYARKKEPDFHDQFFSSSVALEDTEKDPPPQRAGANERQPKQAKLSEAQQRQRQKWRQALAEFQPHKLFALRAADKFGPVILSEYEKAVHHADRRHYESALASLQLATKHAKTARMSTLAAVEKAAEETRRDAKRQKEAFAFTTEVEDKEFGFNTDADARHFYQANTLGEFGELQPSKQIVEMKKVYDACRERAGRLRKMGASIEEIVDAVYQNIPKNFWPDEVVKEVVLFKAVKAELEMEKGLAEIDMQAEAEKFAENAGLVGEKSGEASEYSTMADKIRQNFPNVKDLKSSDLSNALSHLGNVWSTMTDGFTGLLKGAKAAQAGHELTKTEDNPVKRKILEFQRNKAIIDCLSSFSSAGLDLASEKVVAEVVPIISVVTKSKNAAVDVLAAVTYFKNLRQVAVLKKGAAVDPETAALRPLARQYRELSIAGADKVISGVGNALQAIGKTADTGGVSAPAGIAVDVAGKAIRYGGKAIISGIKWYDAAQAVAALKTAIGPPPDRKAQMEVMQKSAQYARLALAQLAKNNDPWAMGHLKKMGLSGEDISHPATSTKLLREYMALKSGGKFADGISEDQETFGDTKVGKLFQAIGRGVKRLNEKRIDKALGRNTKIRYNARWKVKSVPELGLDGWNRVYQEAIEAGWYDCRPDIAAALRDLEESRRRYRRWEEQKPREQQEFESAVAAAAAYRLALLTVRDRVRDIKAVANDRVTPHAGMNAFLNAWYRKADEPLTEVAARRKKWYEQMTYQDENGKPLQGKRLAKRKAQRLAWLEQDAREGRAKRVVEIREAVAQLWQAHKFSSPYGSVALSDFAATAQRKLGLKSEAVEILEMRVKKLAEALRVRVAKELMAARDDEELKKQFATSVQTVQPLLLEGMRVACEQCYKQGGGEDAEGVWRHASVHLKLTHAAWELVKSGAKQGGWEKGGDTGLTGAFKNYEQADGEFWETTKHTPLDRVELGQRKGVVRGRLKELTAALRKFQPLTDKQFVHHGLAKWRDLLIGLCNDRIKVYQAWIDDLD